MNPITINTRILLNSQDISFTKIYEASIVTENVGILCDIVGIYNLPDRRRQDFTSRACYTFSEEVRKSIIDKRQDEKQDHNLHATPAWDDTTERAKSASCMW